MAQIYLPPHMLKVKIFTMKQQLLALSQSFALCATHSLVITSFASWELLMEQQITFLPRCTKIIVNSQMYWQRLRSWAMPRLIPLQMLRALMRPQRLRFSLVLPFTLVSLSKMCTVKEFHRSLWKMYRLQSRWITSSNCLQSQSSHLQMKYQCVCTQSCYIRAIRWLLCAMLSTQSLSKLNLLDR